MKVVVFGTSSGKPTIKRGVSAVAVVRDSDWILFDCGENTQVQISRAGLHPGRLEAIFITHMHGDHINGLPGLLATLGLDQRESGLDLIGPQGIVEYLEVLHRHRVFFARYPLYIRELDKSTFDEAHSVTDLKIVFENPEYTVTATPLSHVVPCFGFRIEEKPRPGRFDIEHARELGIPEGPLYGTLQSGNPVKLPDGRTIEPDEVVGPTRPGKVLAYCLDTRPCDATIALAQNADMLIHDATFGGEYEEEAEEYGHSTVAQAGEVASKAGVKKLILTHISARFRDLEDLLTEARGIFADTDVAEDLMVIEV